MMIKVSNEFLEFDELIEMEKQIKLFEDISTTDGDFSYSFELQKTLLNTKLLGNPFPDNISKPVYQQIPAKILSDSGAETYDGYLRVERITEVYHCSFFAGNNNWFAMIIGLLSDLDLDEYDIDNNETTIAGSWVNTEGLVFPLVDNGSLITRSSPQVKIEDFVAAIYVKSIMAKIFNEAGIKIEGELLTDWRYQNMVCMSNSKSDELINENTSYIQKINPQVVPFDVAPIVITWDNDTVFPYFDGASNNFDLPNNRYIASLKMTVNISMTLLVHVPGGDFGLFGTEVRVNGVQIRIRAVGIGAVEKTLSVNMSINLNAGDILDFTIFQFNVDGFAGVINSGNLKITPTYIYKTIGYAAVPNWTKQTFVSNIFKIFNVLASFNRATSTLTLNLFENIKSKDPIDLSEYISETEVDYLDFISDYGQNSIFSYQEVEFDELKNYNKGKFFKYGQGVIRVNNDFLEQDQEVLTSDFANPIAYINPIFDASLEKTNLIELEEGETFQFSDVADDGAGDAAFNIGNTDAFYVGDLVRIENSTNEVYNGDWTVKSLDGTHLIFNGVPFDAAASGDIVKLNYKYSTSDDVFLFINVPNYAVPNFSDATLLFDSGEINFIAIVYFDLINTGKQINQDFIYSLSFGGIDDPLRYQVTMLESYFRLFERVLNDPVKLFNTAMLPYDVFNRIDFLSPITIKTMESSNSYYLNRISGYKESYLDCELQLIKLP